MEKKKSFLAEVETTLCALLDACDAEALAAGDFEAVIEYVHTAVVDSYKNGIQAGIAKAHGRGKAQNGAAVKMDSAK